MNPSHPAKLGGRFLRGRTHSFLVTRTAAIGVAIGSAAMIVVLSAFNGLETLINNTYGKVHPDITIKSKEGGRFHLSPEVEEALPQLFPNGFGLVQQQKALLRSESREVLVDVHGISREYWSELPWMDSIVSSAHVNFSSKAVYDAAVGIGIADRLAMLHLSGRESLELLWPDGKPDLRLDVTSHFKRQRITPSYIFQVDPQIDNQRIIVDIDKLQALTGDDRIDAIYAWNVEQPDKIQTLLQAVDSSLHAQQPKDIEAALFRVMKSEGLITAGILGFIVLLASLGLYSATVLLSLEKVGQRAILHAIGMPLNRIRWTFWWSGLWISILGSFVGLLLGWLLVYIQDQTGFVHLGNGYGYVLRAYPVEFNLMQSIGVFFFVITVGCILSGWATYKMKTSLAVLRGQRA